MVAGPIDVIEGGGLAASITVQGDVIAMPTVTTTDIVMVSEEMTHITSASPLIATAAAQGNATMEDIHIEDVMVQEVVNDNMNVPSILDLVTELQFEGEMDNMVSPVEISGLNTRKKRAASEGFALMMKNIKSNQHKSFQNAQPRKRSTGKKKRIRKPGLVHLMVLLILIEYVFFFGMSDV